MDAQIATAATSHDDYDYDDDDAIDYITRR